MDIMEKSVIQANPLVMAQKEMNVTELRLFVLGLQDLRPHITDNIAHDVEFPLTLITPTQLNDLFGNWGSTANLKKQVKKAYAGAITLHYKNGGFGFRHIYKIMEYKKEEGLYIQFDDEIKPYVLNLLNKQYTTYKIKEVFPLSSEYAWRIMELLQSKSGYLKTGEKKVYVDISMEDLRFALNVPNEAYKGRMTNFRKYVLAIPIAEINEKTNYKVWYETKKTGRRVTGFVLWMKKKTEEEKEKNTDERKEQELRDALKNNAAVRALADAGVNPATAKVLVEKHGEQRTLVNLKYAKKTKTGRIENFAGYVVSCIENDHIHGRNLFDEIRADEREAEKEQEKKEAYARAQADFDRNYGDHVVLNPYWQQKQKEHGGKVEEE